MSATIGCNYAPDLNDMHPQGVRGGSLKRFSSTEQGERKDTPVLRAIFARAASATILYVL